MKCDELTPVTREYADEYWEDRFAMVYNADEVDAAIAELKAKLESVQASMYADVVDAGMENRKLKRALYKALANWASFEGAVFADEHEAEKWHKMERKCRAKAEEYR